MRSFIRPLSFLILFSINWFLYFEIPAFASEEIGQINVEEAKKKADEEALKLEAEKEADKAAQQAAKLAKQKAAEEALKLADNNLKRPIASSWRGRS